MCPPDECGLVISLQPADEQPMSKRLFILPLWAMEVYARGMSSDRTWGAAIKRLRDAFLDALMRLGELPPEPCALELTDAARHQRLLVR
jgi:hypothetical protein